MKVSVYILRGLEGDWSAEGVKLLIEKYMNNELQFCSGEAVCLNDLWLSLFRLWLFYFDTYGLSSWLVFLLLLWYKLTIQENNRLETEYQELLTSRAENEATSPSQEEKFLR